jgi:hypothetical protein
MNIWRTLCFLRHRQHTFLGQMFPKRSARDSWGCESVANIEIIASIGDDLTLCNCDFYAQSRTPLECEHVPSNMTNFPLSLHIIFHVKYFNGATTVMSQDSRSPSNTPHSVGLLWTNDKSDAENSTWQNTTLTRDRLLCPGGIQNRNLSKQPAADPLPRPRGHWDRLLR